MIIPGKNIQYAKLPNNKLCINVPDICKLLKSGHLYFALTWETGEFLQSSQRNH